MATSSLTQQWVNKARKELQVLFFDLPASEITHLLFIMEENNETDAYCQLVDLITDWVYEDTEVLMPVYEAYNRVKNGDFNQ